MGGAVPMLESLTKSKHKTISTCSSAALKNLYGFEEKENHERSIDGAKEKDSQQDDQNSIHSHGQHSQHSQNTLEKRKKKHKAKELDEILKSNRQPQVQDDDKDSCTSSEDSDSESWNVDKRNYSSDLIPRDDVSQGGISSRLSNISAAKSFGASNDGRSNSQLSNNGNIFTEDSSTIQIDQHPDQRAYTKTSTNYPFA